MGWEQQSAEFRCGYELAVADMREELKQQLRLMTPHPDGSVPVGNLLRWARRHVGVDGLEIMRLVVEDASEVSK